MDNKNDNPTTDEVQNRLEYIFDEETSALAKESGESEGSSLTGLKTVILSIEWEITDEAMATLLEEVEKLEDTYKDDKNLLLFLRLLSTAGKYIKSSKANAHPGALKLLNTVYNSLEIVILSKSISEDEKKKILYTQVKEFKNLKEQIAQKKARAARKKEVTPAVKERKKDVVVQERTQEKTGAELTRDISDMSPQEVLAYVLAQVEQVIRYEFKAFRGELKS